MVENPINGEKYWSCTRSIESLDYDESPLSPWLGILTIGNGYSNRKLTLNNFNRETNQIDDDPNARSLVKPHDLFLTKNEAIIHYKKLCLEYAQELLNEAKHYFIEASP